MSDSQIDLLPSPGWVGGQLSTRPVRILDRPVRAAGPTVHSQAHEFGGKLSYRRRPTKDVLRPGVAGDERFDELLLLAIAAPAASITKAWNSWGRAEVSSSNTSRLAGERLSISLAPARMTSTGFSFESRSRRIIWHTRSRKWLSSVPAAVRAASSRLSVKTIVRLSSGVTHGPMKLVEEELCGLCQARQCARIGLRTTPLK